MYLWRYVLVLKRKQSMVWAKWWGHIVLLRRARKVFERWHQRQGLTSVSSLPARAWQMLSATSSTAFDTVAV